MTLGTIWRVTRAPHADLSGEGARRYGGRWNPVGVPLVYASTTASLAVLETLVHTEPDTAPNDLVLMEIEVEGASLEVHADEDLPRGWRMATAGAAPQRFGAAWVREARSALLVLPSTLLPPAAPDRNVLLNPAHPDGARVAIRSQVAFRFDARLLD